MCSDAFHGGHSHKADDNSPGFKGSRLAWHAFIVAATVVDEEAWATDTEQRAKHNLVVALAHAGQLSCSIVSIVFGVRHRRGTERR